MAQPQPQRNVTSSERFWFHCGRCGSFFQAPAGDFTRQCTHCGADPSLGLLETPPSPATTASGGTKPERPGQRSGGKRSGHKPAHRYLMWKLCGGWLLVLAFIVLAARFLVHVDEPSHLPAITVAGATESDEDAALIHRGFPSCLTSLAGFLAAGTPETRNQFVLAPVTTAARMARFDNLNPLTQVDPATLSLTARGVLRFPGGSALEASWKSSDGKVIDAVFFEENGEWHLDWDHFARYGDYPWSLFLAGSGPDEGAFRLLARERLADERQDAESISLVLYAPRFAHPGEVGFQSPEFLIPRNTRDGQLLDAAFKLARNGGRVFDSHLPALNPPDMIRVRVQVRRIEHDLARKFELAAVLACHWYSIDDPGVQPAPAAEAKQQEENE